MSDKENLMETLKKSRPNAKESTIKMYSSNLLKLQKIIDTDNFKFLNKPDNVKDKISELHFTTQRNYFNAIIVYLMAISEKYNIPIIEDNAECFLSRYKGKMVGTFGSFASYSFENSKHMSCGEGGMIITNDTILAEKCRKSGGHGFKNLKADSARLYKASIE